MFKAKLLNLSPLIEEEVTLDINGVKLVGFSTIRPYKISPNKIYPVDLYFTFLDSPQVEEIDNEEYGAKRIGDSYGYIFKGRVIGNGLNIGNNIEIKDEYFDECSYLEGKYVALKADRLGIEFLKTD